MDIALSVFLVVPGIVYLYSICKKKEITLIHNDATDKNHNILQIKLTKAERTIIVNAFGGETANLPETKKNIHEIILPKVKHKLGWRRICAIKGRVNNWKTTELKYNSEFHRDRHLFGGTLKEQQVEVSKNYSAVVYLDDAKFAYIDNSTITMSHGSTASYVEMDIPAGTIIAFPSCLIHKAVRSSKSKSSLRRTIVLFDIENPDDTRAEHDVYICPKWTQKPFFHKVFNGHDVKQHILFSLMNNRPYLFRYYEKKHNLQRVHWQITNMQQIRTADRVPYNTSFYLITHDAYPSHMTIHNHSSSLYYMWNLLKWNLTGPSD